MKQSVYIDTSVIGGCFDQTWNLKRGPIGCLMILSQEERLQLFQI